MKSLIEEKPPPITALSIDNRALFKLASAVLLQAVEDADGKSPYRERALAWIDGRTDGGLTFQICCDLLGLRAHHVRESLRTGNVIPEPKRAPEREELAPARAARCG